MIFDDLYIRTYVDKENQYYVNMEDLYSHLMVSADKMRHDKELHAHVDSPRAMERLRGCISGIESVAMLIAVGGLGMDMNIKIHDIGDLFNDL